MWRRLLSLSGVLLLAGCYQQSVDSFETINSGAVMIDPAPTSLGVEPGTDATPIVIVPDGAATAAPDELVIIQVTADSAPSSSDLATLPPIPLGPPATATVIIIRPDPDTPTPSAALPNSGQPTATPGLFITPEVPMQLVIPTATPLGQPLAADTPSNGIITPEQFMPELVQGCEYTIVSGDTLFRIALRNNITLASLLSANNLSENSIIRPGQVIQIPGCGAVDPTATPPPPPDVPPIAAPIDPNAAPATLESGAPGAVASQAVHRVRAGDTLYDIAVRYRVTVRAILAINNIPNPDRLQIGQEIIIPAR
ncbi:LysM peptidoglycan-binding domain-containing protein [Aggregatilineales bacterium SYSU G02658]